MTGSKEQAKDGQNMSKTRKNGSRLRFCSLRRQNHKDCKVVAKWETHLRAALPQKEIHINEEEKI